MTMKKVNLIFNHSLFIYVLQVLIITEMNSIRWLINNISELSQEKFLINFALCHENFISLFFPDTIFTPFLFYFHLRMGGEGTVYIELIFCLLIYFLCLVLLDIG